MTTHAMNHQQAIDEHATERYLLREMTSQERHAFEEHYLECAECLEAVTFGAEFLDAGHHVVREEKHQLATPAVPSWRERFLPAISGWLRPVPALAFALVLSLSGIAYQTVAVHRQQQELASLKDLHPEFRFVVTGESRGAARVVKVTHNTQLSVKVEFAPGAEYMPYRADLLSADNTVKYSLPLSVGPNDDSISFSIPAAGLPAGDYSLVIHQQNKAGGTKDLANKFVLQFTD
jgi:hypothetical protein